jgi:hypothetical protein
MFHIDKYNNKYIKTFLSLFGIYIVALSAIMKANFNYIDDVARVASGDSGWEDFGRYINNGLSVIIHAGTYLTDVSPLTQIIAVLFMSLAGVCVINVFEKDKIFNISNVVAVLPLGLSPYFLSCFSFKYDSPYMALSVLVSVLPLLFVEWGSGFYAMMSVIGNLGMCLTYQASSGIYPLMVLFKVYVDINEGKTLKNEGKFICISACSYLAPLAIFYAFINLFKDNGYVSTDTAVGEGLINKCLVNYRHYYSNVYHDFKPFWLVCIAFIIVGFIYVTVKHTNRKKVESVAMAVVTVFAGILICFGVYPFLKNAIFSPRAMYGFGVFVALMAINITKYEKEYIEKSICIILSWCFFVFSFTYGNALAEQQRYTEFRINMVISDLNNLEIMNTNNEKTLVLDGNIGKSPIIRNMLDDYPIIDRLVPSTFASLGGWSEVYFRQYFDIRNIVSGEIDSEEELPVLVDTMYHTIKGNEDIVLIELK